VNFGTSLHWEIKKKGVDVTVLSAGVTDTPMSKSEDIDWSKAPL
jgi:short-subunit dehydrogenase